MTQLPIELLLPVYLASGAILAFVVIALILLFRMRRQIERVVMAVEECRTELIPLAQDARVVMSNLRDLSEKAQWGVAEVENMIEKAQWVYGWPGRLGHRVAAAVKPPVSVMNRKLHGLLTGVRTFVTVMLHGGTHERK